MLPKSSIFRALLRSGGTRRVSSVRFTSSIQRGSPISRKRSARSSNSIRTALARLKVCAFSISAAVVVYCVNRCHGLGQQWLARTHPKPISKLQKSTPPKAVSRSIIALPLPKPWLRLVRSSTLFSTWKWLNTFQTLICSCLPRAKW